MDLSTFYAIVAGTCFALVGLWWNVVERHQAWLAEARPRRRAGGIYLSFLLPGMMAILAQIDPQGSAIWRGAFVIAGAIGVYATLDLVRENRGYPGGSFAATHWLVVVLYLLVVVLAILPEAARLIGLEPLQVGGLLLVLLIAAAHRLSWEFMVEDQSAITELP